MPANWHSGQLAGRAPRSRSSGTGRSLRCGGASGRCRSAGTAPRGRRPGTGCASRSRGDSAAGSPARRRPAPPAIAGCSCRLIAPRIAAAGRLVAQVDRAHRRQRPIQHAPRHVDQRVLARLRPMPAFQRRRGRAQHQRHPFGRGPREGHVAGVVARRRLLLERRSRAPRRSRSAPGAAWGRRPRCGADDDRHLALGDPLPVPVPLGVAQMAVQHGHRAEPRAEPLDRLRRQADLRHQHDRLPAEVDHLLDRLDVDLGLAAAGDAVDQDRPWRRGRSGRRGSPASAACWSAFRHGGAFRGADRGLRRVGATDPPETAA